jgi:AraC family transcriptional regulator, regulatory protein of adaptative response / methylated-DNA-[protein]-cysteine methyltransferase
MSALPPTAVMARAVARRDTDYDGVFVVGVKTTGIFCRPSCPARALPKNHEFFPGPSEALAAGYRPCLRCKPLEVGGALPEWVRKLLDRVDAVPDRRLSDKALRGLGTDPVAARRFFRKRFGMTFQTYCRHRRLGEAVQHIKQGATLDATALEHGYESLSGFRDAFTKTFGKPPRTADGVCLRVAWVESPVSPLLLAATDDGLCALEFSERSDLEGQIERLSTAFGLPVVPGTNAHIQKATRELAEYFTGKRKEFTVSLAPVGTAFQRSVWDELQEIPYGETCSYEDLARAVRGTTKGPRAVGQANGRNRIVILIPCHRVVSKDGTLGGYGGGLWRKQFLLDLERKHSAQ